jgi:hypothetical protein
VAEAVGDEQPPVPVVARVGLGVARDEQRRRVDVALLFDPQVELHVRPVGRQRVDDLLERVGERHDSVQGYMATPPFPTDPEDPLAPARGQSLDGLLRLLERLDGAEEAAVVRSALAAGVSRERVLDELQREVERRLARVREGPEAYPR